MTVESEPAAPRRALHEQFDLGSRAFILLVAGSFLALALFRAGAMPLTDPDEGRYAEISREMLVSGDYVVPHLFSIPYLEKPPLLFWLTTLAFHVFGTGELAARLMPALAATLGLLAAAIFARRVFCRAAGFYTALTLGLCGLYFALARSVVTDMLFSAGLSTALLAYFATREGRWPEIPGHLVFWVALAAATLSKGPAALVLCALAVGVDAALGRRWGDLFRLRLWLGLPLFLVLVLPWFIAVQSRHPDFLSFYLWKEHLSRAAGSEHKHPFYWFVPWLLLGGLPWTPLAIVRARGWVTAARRDTLEGRATRFLLVAASVVFVVFSLSRGKLVTYILPVFPFLAVLVGREVEQWVTSGRGAVPLRRIVAGTCVVYAGLALAAPSLAERYTARPQIRLLEQSLRPQDELAFWGGYFPSAAFYLKRDPYLVSDRRELRFGRSQLDDSGRLVESLAVLRRPNGEGRIFVLTDWRSKRLTELRGQLGEIEVLARNRAAQLVVF